MPNRDVLKRVSKAIVGFFAGLAFWWGISAPYHRIVAPPAEMILRATETPSVTRLEPREMEIIVNRDDFPVRSARPGVPMFDLTFNVILLFALFSASRETFSNRNVIGFLAACALLYVSHVGALIVTVKSIYAMKLGAWSTANYGAVARNVWAGTEHFYRVVGLYGIAFALWWILRPEGVALRLRGNRTRQRRR